MVDLGEAERHDEAMRVAVAGLLDTIADERMPDDELAAIKAANPDSWRYQAGFRDAMDWLNGLIEELPLDESAALTEGVTAHEEAPRG